ncbi:MAG: transposase [Silvibacterium sp.]
MLEVSGRGDCSHPSLREGWGSLSCAEDFVTPSSKDTFLHSLEQTRRRYNLEILGYVIMPEHVHLLVSEPAHHDIPLSKALQALKLSVAKRLTRRPFWQTRYYDFNVFTHNKRIEKLKYMHRNPATRGLVERPEDWMWSSYRHYLLDEPAPVHITRPS